MLTKPFFSRDRVTDFDLISRNSDKLISAISVLSRKSVHYGAFDFQVVAGRLTVDIGTHFLFGHELVYIYLSVTIHFIIFVCFLKPV
jgi:hypothetical protein